jgi:excisionase family DNA binding protein
MSDSSADAIKNYSVKEFCALVGIGRSTFWKYQRQGKIGHIRVGKRVLVPHAEAVRFASVGLGPWTPPPRKKPAKAAQAVADAP